jgi:hypothetical protein
VYQHANGGRTRERRREHGVAAGGGRGAGKERRAHLPRPFRYTLIFNSLQFHDTLLGKAWR